MLSRLVRIFVLLAAILIAGTADAQVVSFRNDVMAVLSKGGCNAGACHGNQNGKGGFKLSLRGQDSEADFAVLTRDTLARRTDPHRPADSLLLLKATASVPHEGGKRFGLDAPEYDILRRWVAAGTSADRADTPRLKSLEVTPAEVFLVEPDDRVKLRVRAHFGDGSVRDVTRLAVYEPSNTTTTVGTDGEARRQGFGETAVLVRYLERQATVRLAWVPERKGFTWRDVPETNYVDKHVFARLRALRMRPSDPCSDEVFLRRVYLDTLGVLPAMDEARTFLADRDPSKRRRLIDRLLQRPEFADFWALKWCDLLRSEEKVLDRKGVTVFHEWIRQAIEEGKPLNEFARDLIASRGSTYGDAPANFYRALRDPQARAEAVAQVFLGVRLQCARCHNHPFDRWTQDDYYGLAAFFPRVQYRILENNRRDRLDTHEFDGEQIVWLAREGEVTHPRSGATVRPHLPGSPATIDPEGDRPQALADWIARPDNPFFARAQVNRVWYHLMGRGLVDPLDDFRASNPPVNGPLLDALADDFVAHHFDLRHLVRTILLSRTYQLSAVPNETNREDETNFAHALIRAVQAEQLLDALVQVTGSPMKFDGYPEGTRAGALSGVRGARGRGAGLSESERFLRTFGKPERSLTCECERSEDTTLGQAFQMVSGELLQGMLSEPDNRLGRLLKSGRSDREIVEELYFAALCRPPGEKERAAALALLVRAKDRRAALEDLTWGLLNAKEFLLRR
jgi:Protein of unknown function (DUF1553)/Protein of unknown function (DUF1549)